MSTDPHSRIVLIGGASHVGKSSLCDALGRLPGWATQSTDELGRHPGRPWRARGQRVMPHVIDHYSSLSPDQLLADVVRYQQRMWPTIQRIIEHRLAAPGAPNLAFQGSALLPVSTGKLQSDRVKPVCLSADPEFLDERIRVSSQYESLNGSARDIVDRFMGRNRLMNDLYVEMANARSVPVIDVGTGVGVEELVRIVTSG